MTVDHLIFNKLKCYPFIENPTGHYVISGGNGIGGGFGSISIHFEISKDGKLSVTRAEGGEGEIPIENLTINKY